MSWGRFLITTSHWSCHSRPHIAKASLYQRYSRRWKSDSTSENAYRILFFGNDEFAVTHLKALLEEKEKANSCIKHIELVTSPDRWTGRKLQILKSMPTKLFAETANIPVHYTPAKSRSLSGWQPPTPFDIGVVVSFGYFITPTILKSLPLGALNVHPSLLPLYRGASPIQYTIMNRDEVGGVTVQELDDKAWDAGRILAQSKVDLVREPPQSYTDLRDRLSSIGAKMLVDTIRNLEHRKANAIVQDTSQVTKAPKIKPEMRQIDFVGMEAADIEALFRAIGQQSPLMTSFWLLPDKSKQAITSKKVNLQLHHIFIPEKSVLRNSPNNMVPGTIAYDPHSNSIHVACKNGTIIGVKRLKAENKSETSAEDFCNGYGLKKGRQGHFERNI